MPHLPRPFAWLVRLGERHTDAVLKQQAGVEAHKRKRQHQGGRVKKLRIATLWQSEQRGSRDGDKAERRHGTDQKKHYQAGKLIGQLYEHAEGCRVVYFLKVFINVMFVMPKQ